MSDADEFFVPDAGDPWQQQMEELAEQEQCQPGSAIALVVAGPGAKHRVARNSKPPDEDVPF
jgi:hypothetical protein